MRSGFCADATVSRCMPPFLLPCHTPTTPSVSARQAAEAAGPAQRVMRRAARMMLRTRLTAALRMRRTAAADTVGQFRRGRLQRTKHAREVGMARRSGELGGGGFAARSVRFAGHDGAQLGGVGFHGLPALRREPAIQTGQGIVVHDCLLRDRPDRLPELGLQRRRSFFEAQSSKSP